MPLLTSIADLIRQQGTDAAERIREDANIRARASQAQAQAIGNIGQTIANVPKQIQQQKQEAQKEQMNAQEMQLRGIQLSEAQQKVADMKALDAAFSKAGGDRASLLNALPGHLRPTVANQFLATDKAKADVAEASEKARKAQAETFGRGAVAVREHGYDPVAAQAMLSTWKTQYADDPATLKMLIDHEQQLQANPTPAFVKSVIDPLISASDQRETDLKERTVKAAETAAGKPTETTLDVRYQALAAKQASGEQLTPAEAGEMKGYEARKRVTKTDTDTTAEMDARYQALVKKRTLRQPLTPDEQAEIGAYEKRKTLVPVATFSMNAPTRETTRTDRSYTQNTARLDAARKPIAQQVERMDRLESTMNQMTPQADALLAPEMMTVMAGGLGSGLRINEAEISRVVGGRSKWESLKAKLNQWSLDPSKALSVTQEQRQEMRALLREVGTRAHAKLQTHDKAGVELADADSVDEHRRIINSALQDLETAGAPTATGLPPGVTVKKIQ